MKYCSNCKMNIGGDAEFCPLCQSELTGTPEQPNWPKVAPEHRRLSLLYRIFAFCVLASCVICVTVDLLVPSPLHWSLLVVVCSVALLVMLRVTMRKHPNLPRLLFQILVTVSFVVLLWDWYVGYTGFSVDYVIPVLCTLTLAVNFVLAFLKRRYAENGLVYFLMNILIGVVPYLLLFTRSTTRPMAWVVCLVVSIITFLGLAFFKGPELLNEVQKRLHM